MADEYIRREDAIRLAEQGQVQGFPWQFQMLIRLQPADVAPVIRCKDCRFLFCSGKCIYSDREHKDDDFCSYGERREERA